FPRLRSDTSEGGRGVERVVPRELERVTMELVRTRLGHEAHGAAGVGAVLGVLAARLDLELLQRVRERQRHVEAVEGVVVDGAVEDIGHAERLTSGDGNATPAGLRTPAGSARAPRGATERAQRRR